jgi:hypothetical protein
MTTQGSLELVGLLVIYAWFMVMSSLNTEVMGLVAKISDYSSASWLLRLMTIQMLVGSLRVKV